MYVTSTRGMNKLVSGGHEYEPIQGFVFDLPLPLAEHLLAMSDAQGPLWRLPVQEDYDLPDEVIAAPTPKPVKRPAPRQSAKPAPRGIPGPDVRGE